jgi:hypothetical protein
MGQQTKTHRISATIPVAGKWSDSLTRLMLVSRDVAFAQELARTLCIFAAGICQLLFRP